MSPGWRAGAQAGLVVAAAVLLGGAGAPEPSFAPPLGRPLLLSRTLVRDLGGGEAIVATRSYRIVFQRTEAGWEVEGALVASEIDAPAPLAALAAIERARPDDGLFPIRLDAAGRIVAREDSAGQGRAAVEQALKAAGQAPGSADPGFLARIAQASAAGGITRWPETLFLPAAGHSEDAREIVLPDGSAGRVEVTLDQAAGADATLMARAERTVTTDLGGVRRVARETWTIAPDNPHFAAR